MPLCFIYNLYLNMISQVQHEAKLGLKILDKESPESFSLLFMNKIAVNRKFEYLLQ